MKNEMRRTVLSMSTVLLRNEHLRRMWDYGVHMSTFKYNGNIWTKKKSMQISPERCEAFASGGVRVSV